MGRKKCNSPRAGLAKGGKCGGGKKTKYAIANKETIKTNNR